MEARCNAEQSMYTAVAQHRHWWRSDYLHSIAVDIVKGRRRQERSVVVVVHLYRPRVRRRTIAFQQLHVSQGGENNLSHVVRERVSCVRYGVP